MHGYVSIYYTIDRRLVEDYNGRYMTNPYQSVVYEKQENISS